MESGLNGLKPYNSEASAVRYGANCYMESGLNSLKPYNSETGTVRYGANCYMESGLNSLKPYNLALRCNEKATVASRL